MEASRRRPLLTPRLRSRPKSPQAHDRGMTDGDESQGWLAIKIKGGQWRTPWDFKCHAPTHTVMSDMHFVSKMMALFPTNGGISN